VINTANLKESKNKFESFNAEKDCASGSQLTRYGKVVGLPILIHIQLFQSRC
jgi:hypothetical protein